MAPKCGNVACLGGVSRARVRADAPRRRLRRQYPNGRRFPRPREPSSPRAAHLTSALSPRKRPCGARAGCPRVPPRPPPCATPAACCARPARPASPRARRGSFRSSSLKNEARSFSSSRLFLASVLRFRKKKALRDDRRGNRARRRSTRPFPPFATGVPAVSRLFRRERPSQVQARLVLLVVLDRLPQARGGGRPGARRGRTRRQTLGRVRPVRPLVAPLVRARQRRRVSRNGTRGAVRGGACALFSERRHTSRARRSRVLCRSKDGRYENGETRVPLSLVSRARRRKKKNKRRGVKLGLFRPRSVVGVLAAVARRRRDARRRRRRALPPVPARARGGRRSGGEVRRGDAREPQARKRCAG